MDEESDQAVKGERGDRDLESGGGGDGGYLNARKLCPSLYQRWILKPTKW